VKIMTGTFNVVPTSEPTPRSNPELEQRKPWGRQTWLLIVAGTVLVGGGLVTLCVNFW
jgi:hypothetical protein